MILYSLQQQDSITTGLKVQEPPSPPAPELLKAILGDVQPRHWCIYQRSLCLALCWQHDHELKCFWSKTWSFLRNLSHRINTCSLVWKFKTSHGWRMTMLPLYWGSFSSLRTRAAVMLLLPNFSHSVKLLLHFICVSHAPQLPTFSFSQARFQSSCNNVITLLNENLGSSSNIVPLATTVTAFILMER